MGEVKTGSGFLFLATTMVLLCLVAVGGCTSRDHVIVVDAVSGKPIAGAEVKAIYLSYGLTYKTNAKGVAHINGLGGLPRGGVGVEVNALGYESHFFATYPTEGDPDGWTGDNLKFRLMPIPEQVPWWMQVQ